MVKVKKAALGAFGMASLQSFGIGGGGDAANVPQQSFEVNDHEHIKRLKKKRSTTSSVKATDERKQSEGSEVIDSANRPADVCKYRRRLKASSGSERHSDIVFLVGEEPDIQRIPAHSWILIKGSPVFRVMFKGPLSPVTSINEPNNKLDSNITNSEEQSLTLAKDADSDTVGEAQLDPVIEDEDEIDSACDSMVSKPCTDKVSDISTHPKSSVSSSINLSSNENMAMKGSVNSSPSNNKELSNDICDYANSDKNIDNSGNTEPVKTSDKDLNFSKGNNADNGSVFGTSDSPSTSCKRGGNNGFCITSNSMHDSVNKKSTKNIGSFVGGKKASIAVSDVDGRAFDILLKYLYNESIDLPSVMTALTTLYAAHKYMCPGLAKEVVSFLKIHLNGTNVLLILQHICLYCSSATDHTSNIEPVTSSPVSFFATALLGHGGMGLATQISSTDTSQKTHSSDHGVVPSAPPAESSAVAETATDIENIKKDTILSIPDTHIERQLDHNDVVNTSLINDELVLEPETTEDDLRDFENSMTVSDSNGGWGPRGKRKINCCKVLMKKCLELIDTEASSVLACEDIEDLDVTTLRMIVCRETLCVQSETEVFNALKRWSDRECRRQHLELTPVNRRRVLEGCQYLVRYLTLTREEFFTVPYRSGLLCKDEEEALLAQISCRGTAKATAAAVDLPEHLWQWQSIMRTKRRGKTPAHGIQITSGRKFTYSGLGSSSRLKKQSTKKGKGMKTVEFDKSKEWIVPSSGNRGFSLASTPSLPNTSANGTNAKEKFNFVEEFFVCLACIFD